MLNTTLWSSVLGVDCKFIVTLHVMKTMSISYESLSRSPDVPFAVNVLKYMYSQPMKFLSISQGDDRMGLPDQVKASTGASPWRTA